MNWPDLSRYSRVSLDTETTGVTSNDRPVGCSIFAEDGRKTYLRWGHEAGGNNCSLPEFRRWAGKELNRPKLKIVMHNAGFDNRMLAYERVLLPKARIEDTGFAAALLNELEPSFKLDDLSQKYTGVAKSDQQLNEWCAEHFGGAATRKAQAGNYWRAPGDIVAPYAIGDAEMTDGLYQVLRPRIDQDDLADVYELETKLIPILLRMHMVGVRADPDYARKLQKKLIKQRNGIRGQWEQIAGKGANYGSPVDLKRVWTKLNLPMTLTDKGNPSFAKEVLEYMTHPVAQMVKQLRQLDWFINVAIESYVFGNVDANNIIHGEFHPLKMEEYGTVSGRFSSGGGLNLQNWPARDEEIAPMIRAMLIPYNKDSQWLKVDYSQIEYRYLAHYAGGPLADAYNNDPLIDFHQMVAELTGIPRKPAKNINFGIVYGMGVALMALKLGVSHAEAQEMLDEYHGRLPQVNKLYKQADRRAKRRGYILTWGGRKRRFAKTGTYYKNTHKALNALLQGSAADLIKMAMIEVDNLIDWDSTLMHLTVHDELDFSVPKGKEGAKITKQIVEVMESYELIVPIRAEAELGPDWGHGEKIAA